MNITLAKTAGFCFGVNRAVQMVYDLVDSGQKVCTLGPIIHNSQMVEELKSKGVRVVDIASEAFQDEILVIRSHGVGKSVYDAATNAGVQVCDATCPFVAKIHKIVAEQSAAGNVILIAVDEILEEKRVRHIDSFAEEHPELVQITSGANKLIYKSK